MSGKDSAHDILARSCPHFASTELFTEHVRLDQPARVQKFCFAQAWPDKLKAGDGNSLVIHWNRYRQCRIAGEVHRGRVLQVQHLGFKKNSAPEERNCVNGKFLANNPKAAAAATRALLRGAKWVETNPAAAARLSVEKKYLASSPELNTLALSRLHYIS